jgi:hypothetical protein
MTNNGIRMSAILLASVMAFAGPIDAMAAGKPGGGGHPGGGGGHGGGGGGGAHFGGGGGGAHFSGGSRGGGAAHIHTAPSISRSSARTESSRNRASSGNRTLADHTAPSRAAGHGALLNSGRTATSNARANHGVHDRAVRNTLNSRSVEGALHNRSELHNPDNRVRISAAAATAGWHNGREGGRGWWQHGNGGYGWVGPLYWPFRGIG